MTRPQLAPRLIPSQSPLFSTATATLALAALALLAACSHKPAPSKQTSDTSAAPQTSLPPKAEPSQQYASAPAGADDNVLTYHNDSDRTGLDSSETLLTPANVNPSSFGKLFSDPVDGFVYAQPLYVAGVNVPGKGRHNIVYVATENDSVYAFDADSSGPPLWHASLLNGGSPVTSSEVACGQIVPRIGVTGTPVIDLATRTLYAVAMVKLRQAGHTVYAQQLHALDLSAGAEKLGGPVSIAGSVAGKGAGSVNGRITFDAFAHLNRPGLALSNGVLYIAFGSHCDLGDYHGWVFAYGAAHLHFRAVWNATPDGTEAAIWQTGDAPAVDSSGHVYVMTGNGTFDANTGGADYGDSFVKLALDAKGLHPIDFFTPFDQQSLSDKDLDIGSGGPLLVPTVARSAKPLIVGGGKNAVLYVVNRDRMGGFHQKGDDQIVQAISGQLSGIFSTPAWWNGRLYIGTVGQSVKAFSLSAGHFSLASQTPDSFDYPGTTPSISSNGKKNAIVWALETGGYISGASAILRAYDATDLSHELYTSPAHGGPGTGGVKFTTPTIAHGHVYFGTQHFLEVYGLRR